MAGRRAQVRYRAGQPRGYPMEKKISLLFYDEDDAKSRGSRAIIPSSSVNRLSYFSFGSGPRREAGLVFFRLIGSSYGGPHRFLAELFFPLLFILSFTTWR